VSDTRVKLYRLAFLGNPTPRLPARLVPLFRLEDPYEIYLQVGDDSGEKVLEFRRADLGSFSEELPADAGSIIWRNVIPGTA
jgi:hypothetical protein